jgi:hypothetical protein
MGGGDLTGVGIDEIHGVSRPVHEQLLAEGVFLAHHRIGCLAPGSILLAVPAVGVSVGVIAHVLGPQ